MKAEKQIIIKQEDYDSKKQAEWENIVEIVRWEHDFERQIYIIDYNIRSENEMQA